MGELMHEMMAGVEAPTTGEAELLLAYLQKYSQRPLDPNKYPAVNQLAHVALASHAHHHALEDHRPLRRVMHRRIGQVVALHAILHGEPRTARFRRGKLRQPPRGREDALEHRPVGALGPAPLGLLDKLRQVLSGSARRHDEKADGKDGGEVHAAIILGRTHRPE